MITLLTGNITEYVTIIIIDILEISQNDKLYLNYIPFDPFYYTLSIIFIDFNHCMNDTHYCAKIHHKYRLILRIPHEG